MDIQIPYTPRPLQAVLHKELDKHRFSVLVMHRRFGKTLMVLAHLLRDAVQCEKKAPRFHYITATRVMAKQVAWDYVKMLAEGIPSVKFNETELTCTLPNGARLQLLGADDGGERLRGIYSDGLVLDEVSLLSENLFTQVIRPMLSDRAYGNKPSYAIMIGTPAGHNLFYDYWQKAGDEDDWFRAMYKADETNIIAEEELEAARASMTEDAFRQEFLCSFEAATPGAIFAKDLAEIEERGQITHVPYDPAVRVDVFFDLGVNDATAVIFTQKVGRALPVIDCFEARNEGLPFYARMLDEKGYLYGQMWAPHDIEVRDWSGSGKTRREIAYDLGINFRVVPKLPLEDGLHAAKLQISKTWFDRENCHDLLEAMRFYHRVYDPKNRMYRSSVKHDWSSHYSDCWRYCSVAQREAFDGMPVPQKIAQSNYNPLQVGV